MCLGQHAVFTVERCINNISHLVLVSESLKVVNLNRNNKNEDLHKEPRSLFSYFCHLGYFLIDILILYILTMNFDVNSYYKGILYI